MKPEVTMSWEGYGAATGRDALSTVPTHTQHRLTMATGTNQPVLHTEVAAPDTVPTETEHGLLVCKSQVKKQTNKKHRSQKFLW